MSNELVFSVEAGTAQRAEPVSLEEAGLKERAHLQEWVRKNPRILGEDVLIVAFEFSDWQRRDRRETDRLDLLGLGGDGRLVVAELKRGDAPDTIDMQAVKYAASASRFTEKTLAQAHADYLRKAGNDEVTVEKATALLQNHVGGELDPDKLRQPRIVLIASSFSRKVTTSAVWLSEMGVNVTLIEFNAYRTKYGLVLTVSQKLPVPDVEDFMISPRESERREFDEQVRTRRETNAVVKLVQAGTLPDDTQLELKVEALPPNARDPVRTWIKENPNIGRATWQNDKQRPLKWAEDDEAYSPTGLTQEILDRAVGQRPAIGGPGAWLVVESGKSLVELAASPSAADPATHASP